MEDEVKLTLRKDEAIVLFELLSRFKEGELRVVDQAEERVLWDILADLERDLTEPLSAGYKGILEEARGKVRDNDA